MITLFHGSVYHQRLQPVGHGFQYPLFFCGFDLEQLRNESTGIRLFGYNRRAPLSLKDGDYLDGSPVSLYEKIRRFIRDPDIVHFNMFTVPRVFGYAFNPVTFYLGYDRQGQIHGALAEVNNTFKERHVYVLDSPARNAGGFVHFRTAKDFHVSPFNDRRGQYLFRMRDSGDRIEVHVDIEKDGTIIFRSGLVGVRSEPLSDRAILKAMIRYPLQNLLTLPRIHWQAAKLYFGKTMRYFPKPGPRNAMTILTAPPTTIERIGMNVFFRLLKTIQAGHITVTLPDGSRTVFGTPDREPGAELNVIDYTFFRRILLDGDIGLGEAYMYGQWTSPDVTSLISFFIANRESMRNGELASSRLKWMLNRTGHLLRRNTKSGSRKNISAHYDLSNDFFALFLDKTLMYSSAFFTTPDETLETAQYNKMEMLIQKADIRNGHHILEIGSGWGGFAMEIARRTGCRVTSVTISREQLKLARERVRAAGLDDRVHIEFCDYRDLNGDYDRIVSIEMLEAVGHDHFDTFFQKLDRLLKEGGRAVLQTITMPPDRYEAYRRSVDWIQKHIFPGGHLPSVDALKDSMARCSRLYIRHMEDIGLHYAATLKVWSRNLAARRNELFAMGYDDVFYRTWQYYFSYCEAAFATRAIGNMHLIIERNPC